MSPAGAVDELSRVLMGATLSGGSRQAILSGIDQAQSASTRGGLAPASENGYAALPAVAALVIGSPEFQRR